mmetsp:Transcript_40403/g.86766  ORF Transcript_40403/g.86766 Transcript_40403/m.86766 type:complete len:119 (+) Transcript_40403:259-615(+)
MPTGIAYETLGLDVNFQNCSWDDATNPIKFLSVYEALDQAAGLCTKCAKQATFRCSVCKCANYCSSACQQNDWPRHKEACRSLAGLDTPSTTGTTAREASRERSEGAEIGPVSLDSMD